MAKLTHPPKLAGFTLIEMVIVLGILLILGVLISGSLGSLFRSSTKTARWQLVKSEGDKVVEIISRMSRLALKPLDCQAGSGYFTILNPDGGTTRFIFLTDKIASRSAAFGEDIETSTNDTILHNSTKTQVTAFSLDCSGFSAGGWGSWINLDFTLQDKIDPDDPVSLKFQTGIAFRNR